MIGAPDISPKPWWQPRWFLLETEQGWAQQPISEAPMSLCHRVLHVGWYFSLIRVNCSLTWTSYVTAMLKVRVGCNCTLFSFPPKFASSFASDLGRPRNREKDLMKLTVMLVENRRNMWHHRGKKPSKTRVGIRIPFISFPERRFHWTILFPCDGWPSHP